MGEGSILQVVIIFVGFATMDLSHDLLLMPARALLNDRLPDEQTDQGNAYFASISSIGTCIGLALTIIPLENYFPWSMLDEPVRATFTTAMVLILACNLTTLYISSGLDKRTNTNRKPQPDERTMLTMLTHSLSLTHSHSAQLILPTSISNKSKVWVNSARLMPLKPRVCCLRQLPPTAAIVTRSLTSLRRLRRRRSFGVKC
jgi:hypothetical protein